MKRLIPFLLLLLFTTSGCAFVPMLAGAPMWITATVSGVEKGVMVAAYLDGSHNAEIGAERPLPALFLHDKGLDKAERQKAWHKAQEHAKKVKAEKEKAEKEKTTTQRSEQPPSVTVGLLYLKCWGGV